MGEWTHHPKEETSADDTTNWNHLCMPVFELSLAHFTFLLPCHTQQIICVDRLFKDWAIRLLLYVPRWCGEGCRVYNSSYQHSNSALASNNLSTYQEEHEYDGYWLSMCHFSEPQVVNCFCTASIHCKIYDISYICGHNSQWRAAHCKSMSKPCTFTVLL